jgi:hypothetical protein
MDAIVTPHDPPPGISLPDPPLGHPRMMPSTGTNILALPVVEATIESGNGEDFVETFLYLVDNGSGDATTFPQLDLRGIDFTMTIRRAAGDNEIIMRASTLEGTMAIGAPPNIGYLICYQSLEDVMQYKEADSYVGDILAFDGNFSRVCLLISLTITEGVTR